MSNLKFVAVSGREWSHVARFWRQKKVCAGRNSTRTASHQIAKTEGARTGEARGGQEENDGPVAAEEGLEGRKDDQGHLEKIRLPQRSQMDIQADGRRSNDIGSGRIGLSGETNENFGAAHSDEMYYFGLPKLETIQLF